jgi:ABC-2 type transport system permease protein
MSAAKNIPPSFSRTQRWRNIFDRSLRTLLVLAVVVMVNYLGAKFSSRHYLSSQTSVTLAPRTLAVLHSLTNQVDVTLYFNRQADFYPDVAALLDAYSAANKKISVRLVDYARDAGEAQKTKIKYGLNAATDKNLIIFDSGGHTKMFPGESLLEYGAVGMTEDKKIDIRPVRFNGEKVFTAMLLALESPQPLKAYFLIGHGELLPNDTGQHGYQKFGAQLEQNYFALAGLQFTADRAVPDDCNLLVIAAPRLALTETELQKIENYLRAGGRLLVLFNINSLARATGLEPLLQRWGVSVVADYVKDAEHTINTADVVVSRYGKHPVTASLAQSSLQMDLPRPAQKISGATANTLQVDELLFSGENSTLANDRTAAPRSYSLACAVEQKPVAGVVNPHGNARLLVVGDAMFLGNTYIEAGGNRDFLNAAVNWLVERPQFIEGVGPRSITEFRLLLTDRQQYQLRWLLLGALPGGVLFLGWLVWLVRRK